MFIMRRLMASVLTIPAVIAASCLLPIHTVQGQPAGQDGVSESTTSRHKARPRSWRRPGRGRAGGPGGAGGGRGNPDVP